MDYKKQLYLTGAIFTLHNIEESVGFANFSFPDYNSYFFIESFNKISMIPAIIAITFVAWGIILLGK